MQSHQIETLQAEVKDVLENNILRFWLQMRDAEHGGFYGQMTGNGRLMKQADKGAILNARILWTFSAAYRMLKKEEYLQMATHAKRFLIDHFYDKEFGGIYWSLNYKGEPVDTKKQIYALGFAIYGLSEYVHATGDEEALQYAIKLYHSIEEHSFDTEKNGYFEAFTRQWTAIADMRLSEKDRNECKTTNTHLHILEPYTNLYRVWKDDTLKKQLENLIRLFSDKIVNPTSGHLELFFDDDWNSKYAMHSYGHDIEAAWLLHEAAIVLGNEALLQQVEPLVKHLSHAADEGLTPDGTMIYETLLSENHTDRDLHWWVQAENIVGHLNLYQYFKDETALHTALRCWEFVKTHLIDYTHGEWYWSIRANGSVNLDDDKAGFWKCPYHNSRMCIEAIERF